MKSVENQENLVAVLKVRGELKISLTKKENITFEYSFKDHQLNSNKC